MIRIKRKFLIIATPFFCLLTFSFLYFNSVIPVVEEVPAVFDQSKFSIKFENEGTWLYQNEELTFPITHDDKCVLYILNGAGQDLVKYDAFSRYKIDKANQEIVLKYNLLSYIPRQKVSFQVIQIPFNIYSDIIENDKIRVHIKSGSAYYLMEYDFQTKNYRIIDSYLYAK